ncbi:ABC transporter substrate-binding protein [candidate division KSB3 bacterium]|uniref:ABC transporter substrate-binding protein n=1 Tax=candidate division KSB3 bacterium TaxID=2044937 RepID=A0A9D5JUP2_9BACT|nr:ABC transporter substrate-binding protein [candidate division KSB3 bacterium]MBD3324587.1 ABC transporter substrate-binding protein [candidate division KSB3 bacterium]
MTTSRRQWHQSVAIGLAVLLVIGVLSIPGTSQAKEKVVVAFVGPLSGGTAANGLGGRNSADLAVRLRNADPEAKYEYELTVFDDECKPNIGVQGATKLAADRHVIGAVTHYCSAVALGAVDIYHRFGLPVIVWGAVHPDITYGNDYPEVHRVNGTMINQNRVAAEFMTGLGYKTWAIIHDTTDYGKGHNEYFSQYLEEFGGEILGTFGVTADQQDFTAELTQIKALDPDVLYFGGLTPIGVRIRTQMEKLGLDAQFQGTSGIISDAFIEGVADLAEGVVACREGAPTEKLAGGQFFIENYEKQGYSQPADAYGPFAFAAMNLLLDTIEEVGPDRKNVVEALNNVKDRESIVGTITFDEHGQNITPVITKYVVQDGVWTLWEDSEYASGERQLKGL